MSSRGSQTGSETARRNSQSGSDTARSRTQSNKGSACSSPRSRQGSQHTSPNRGRHNKIYHTPPTPPPEVQLEKEKSFVLDSMAVSSISKDYAKTNPKLGPVIPPYNACNDKDVKEYFKFIGVKDTLDKRMSKPRNQKRDKAEEPDQYWPYTSIDGKVQDHFNSEGAGHRYLGKRNQFGAGHSRELTDGHAQFMQGVKPITGYNGSYGYRRTSPWLRMKPSPFGTASTSPCYDPSVIEHIRERNEVKQSV